ncbi:putative F-box/FBD/LRR-repeat protein At5g44960 [Diospyros lotus]|uniref:putative F-box/FBD/LRR-repeat protein At5g44960 n=1 Tax=Diospyros lotus TaxID=55363 RepID=UPI00224E40D6|nr:putative F-box/FBD/LRR-repeat protein At5g44960 [Diospyros lotus]
MAEERSTNSPRHIIVGNLSKLLLDDAATASTSSENWRDVRLTDAHSILDDEWTSDSSPDQAFIQVKYIVHSSRIRDTDAPPYEFNCSTEDIDKLIYDLSLHSVAGLSINMRRCDGDYELPPSLYSCRELIQLKLSNFALKSRPTFDCFRSMKRLELECVRLDEDALDRLISGCPQLERLALVDFGRLSLLKIHAPNLEFLEIGGVFDRISLESTSRLDTVRIGAYENAGYDQNPKLAGIGNLIKFFESVPHVQRLEVNNFFLKVNERLESDDEEEGDTGEKETENSRKWYLSIGREPVEMLPTTQLWGMKHLSISIDFNCANEIRAAFCILKCCPNLQELLVRVYDDDEKASRETNVHVWMKDQMFPMSHLRVVNISRIPYDECALTFIDFLLVNSLVLERMTVVPRCSDLWGKRRLCAPNPRWLKALLSFRRASPLAQVIYL